jgi:predicted site-specific integrase-resolvase
MLLNTEDYLTAEQVKERFKVSLKTIYHWSKNGLVSERFMGRHLFRKEVVAAFVPPRGSYQRRSK